MNELRYPSPNKLGAIKLRKWICEVKLKEPIWTRINQKNFKNANSHKITTFNMLCNTVSSEPTHTDMHIFKVLKN